MARTLLGHQVVMRSVLVALALLAGSTFGCGAVVSAPEDQAPEHPLEGRVPTTPPVWGKNAGPAPVCKAPTPLLVHHDAAGRVDRLHAQLSARGMVGDFLVDTGSLKSYATHSDVEDVTSTSTVIFCKETTLPIIARLRPGTTPDGSPQAGVLGSDLVAFGSVLDFDLARGKLAWYTPAPAPPKGAVVLPIEYRHGWLVASGIQLEGRDVKLVVDTGASNVVVVDKTPRPNEVREDTVDGTASPITLWHGEGELAFAGDVARHVPVDRTDAFPTLEGLIAELGSDVVGLLGLTSLGRDRVIIGHDSLILMLPPVVPNPR